MEGTLTPGWYAVGVQQEVAVVTGREVKDLTDVFSNSFSTSGPAVPMLALESDVVKSWTDSVLSGRVNP